MKLIPIKETLEQNKEYTNDPVYKEIIEMTIEFQKKVGFVSPWIGYLVKRNDNIIGTAGFKGPPQNGIVEIAYGTFEKYRNQGFGTAICRLLVSLSLKTSPTIKIIARTFSKDNFSASILLKNNFKCAGTVNDPDDGEIWEWLFKTDN